MAPDCIDIRYGRPATAAEDVPWCPNCKGNDLLYGKDVFVKYVFMQ